MAKITSRYEVSIPKALADQVGLHPGDEVEWRAAGDELRVSPTHTTHKLSVEERLASFDAATKRQAARNDEYRATHESRPADTSGRGWTREELYDRGRPR